MKQQGMGLLMLAEDCNGTLPYSRATGSFKTSAYNIYRWPEYWSHADCLYTCLKMRNVSLYHCPSSEGAPRLSNYWLGSGVTDPYNGATRSYFANANIMPYVGNTAPYFSQTDLGDIAKPAEKIMLIEGLYYQSAADPNNEKHIVAHMAGGPSAIAYNYNAGSGLKSAGCWWSTYKPARYHHEGSNVLFVDGHVAWRKDAWTNSAIW